MRIDQQPYVSEFKGNNQKKMLKDEYLKVIIKELLIIANKIKTA